MPANRAPSLGANGPHLVRKLQAFRFCSTSAKSRPLADAEETSSLRCRRSSLVRPIKGFAIRVWGLGFGYEWQHHIHPRGSFEAYVFCSFKVFDEMLEPDFPSPKLIKKA
uniref:Uncharacterized protein n=1 Tax=Fagus sylvatica TaxID=28930 RepID=A0A2N9IXA7_FAGSY